THLLTPTSPPFPTRRSSDLHVVRRTLGRDQSQRVGPGQSGTLAITVDRRLMPGGEEIDALLGLAIPAGLLAVHVDAIGAAVEDRDRKSTRLNSSHSQISYAV